MVSLSKYTGSHIRAINFMQLYLTEDGSSMKRRTKEEGYIEILANQAIVVKRYFTNGRQKTIGINVQ